MIVRDATRADINNKIKETLLSPVPCGLCKRQVYIRDVRKAGKLLCGNCEMHRAALSRRDYFNKSNLTPLERQKIVKQDRTVKVGPFFKSRKETE